MEEVQPELQEIGKAPVVKGLTRTIRVLLTSLAIVMWFYSITGLLKLITGGVSSYSAYFCILVVALLYLGIDGDLSELVGFHEYALSNNAAAGVVAASAAIAG